MHTGGFFDPDQEQSAAVGTHEPTLLAGVSCPAQVAVAAGAAAVVVVDAEAVGGAHGLVAGQLREPRRRGRAAPPPCPRCGPGMGDGASGSSGFRSGCKDP